VTARRSRPLLALAAGLALADASVVALALPALLQELDTTVEGVAAVLGVYVLVLALSLLPAERALRRWGPARLGVAGFTLFALASLGCAAADSLGVLLVARSFQAVGGAAGLVAAFAGVGRDGRGLWTAAAVFGTACGPALGGAVTQVLDWRWVFIVQAPIAVAAAVAAWRLPSAPPDDALERDPFKTGPAIALALVSAALTAVLFLLVLELVAGFSIDPLVAAAAVTALPLAALASSRIRGPAGDRAVVGCVLVAAGTLCLAFLPGSSAWWTVPPQLLAGAGMGLALPALAGELLPERTTADAATLLTIRHVGIVLALAGLAPLVSNQLDDVTRHAQLQGVALVLDAKLPPQKKIQLAPDLLSGVETDDPRSELQDAIADHRGDFSGDELVEYDRLAERADDTLVAAVTDAFDEAFLVTGALALLGALALVVTSAARARSALAVAALAAVPVYAGLHESQMPEPVRIADPCEKRALPDTGGLTGALQDAALRAVDRAACKFGSSREELVLALADEDEAKQFQKEHGVNPRSFGGILQGLIG
jgi:predicted MFS family arabinose efflux permease